MSDLSNQKTTSQDRKETAHKANAVSSRVWLDDQCGHSCLEEVLDRHGNSSSEVRHRTGNDRPIAARRFLVQLTHTEPRRIIAVVPDFDDENIIPSPAMTIYEPIEQEQGWNGRLFVRAHQDAYALVPAITQTIHGLSADQPVEKASTLGDVRAEVLSPDRLNAIVFGGFAAVALLISVVGVAGVLAFSVSGRTREFGIRMALGALPRNILAIVLVEGMAMAGIGVGAGVVVGFALARAIARYVTDIHQPGPLAFVASAVVILGAAVIASAVPAARAARVNAVEALRSE
jgi:putative ABC transport system permease protein